MAGVEWWGIWRQGIFGFHRSDLLVLERSSQNTPVPYATLLQLKTDVKTDAAWHQRALAHLDAEVGVKKPTRVPAFGHVLRCFYKRPTVHLWCVVGNTKEELSEQTNVNVLKFSFDVDLRVARALDPDRQKRKLLRDLNDFPWTFHVPIPDDPTGYVRAFVKLDFFRFFNAFMTDWGGTGDCLFRTVAAATVPEVALSWKKKFKGDVLTLLGQEIRNGVVRAHTAEELATAARSEAATLEDSWGDRVRELLIREDVQWFALIPPTCKRRVLGLPLNQFDLRHVRDHPALYKRRMFKPVIDTMLQTCTFSWPQSDLITAGVMKAWFLSNRFNQGPLYSTEPRQGLFEKTFSNNRVGRRLSDIKASVENRPADLNVLIEAIHITDHHWMGLVPSQQFVDRMQRYPEIQKFYQDRLNLAIELKLVLPAGEFQKPSFAKRISPFYDEEDESDTGLVLSQSEIDNSLAAEAELEEQRRAKNK